MKTANIMSNELKQKYKNQMKITKMKRELKRLLILQPA